MRGKSKQLAILIVGIIQYPKHEFKKGDKVTDITVKKNRWPDVQGVVTKIDGALVRVKYTSGKSRWTVHLNLKKRK